MLLFRTSYIIKTVSNKRRINLLGGFKSQIWKPSPQVFLPVRYFHRNLIFFYGRKIEIRCVIFVTKDIFLTYRKVTRYMSHTDTTTAKQASALDPISAPKMAPYCTKKLDWAYLPDSMWNPQEFEARLLFNITSHRLTTLLICLC